MPKTKKYRDTSRNQDNFEGDFRIYFYRPQPNARARLPRDATMRNHVITVRGGQFQAGDPFIVIRIGKGDDNRFILPYDWVDIVVQDNGALIWQNRYHHALGRR